MSAEPVGTEYRCTRCPAVAGGARLPRGWKDYDGPVCKACVLAGFCVRAVALPVARIVGRADAPDEGAEPVEGFLRHFHAAWRLSTDLANWAMRELVRRDVRRTPQTAALPKYDPAAMFGTFPRRQRRAGADPDAPQVGTLYSTWNDTTPPEWRAAWDGCAAAAGAVLADVEGDWKNHPSFGRFAVLWRGKARPMVFAYPYPFPATRQSWRAWWQAHEGGRRPYLSVPMPGGRLVLELDRSAELRRQLDDFDRIATGAARGAEARLVPVSRGGRVVGVKAVLVGRFPRAAAGAGEGAARAARVTTGADVLLTVCVPGREPFVVSGDQVRGAVYDHTRWLARYRADMKHEKRWPARKRRRMTAGGARAKLDRQAGRIDSEVKQMAAAVVGYARRQRCGALVYRDAERSFVPSLPWHALRERLKCLCAEGGLEFRHEASESDAVGGEA